MTSYKNLWSLNVDEAVTAGILQGIFKKQAQVYFPLNAQLKDVDLLLGNSKHRKTILIQVKGSKAYEPSASEKAKFGDGSVGWFFIPKNKIKNCTADYFIFLIHVINDAFNNAENRKTFSTHLLTITPSDLYKICRRRKRAFDYRDSPKKGIVDLRKYLDLNGVRQLRRDLRI